MADWSALTRGFQGGANWAQDFRANQQFERGREQALEYGERDLKAQRGSEQDLMDMYPDETDGMSLFSFDPTVGDPVAYRMFSKFKGMMGRGRRKKKRAALPAQAPVEDTGVAQTYGIEDYAKGGSVHKPREPLGDRKFTHPEGSNEPLSARERARLLAEQERLNAAPAQKPGVIRRAVRGVGRVGALGALGGTALETASTPTEQYRERFGLETDDPSFAGDLGVRTLGAASDLANVATLGAAGHLYRDKQRLAREAAGEPVDVPAEFLQAPPAGSQRRGLDVGVITRGGNDIAAGRSGGEQESQRIDFSDLDIDPKDVPDMKTDDWKNYRRMLIRDATRRGQPVDQVQDRITSMQQKGFLNYAQQGLALQQAGNPRGAMAAYRAAYQYFPNGYDVEFGTHKGRDGTVQIVGVGMDEKTGKRVSGTEMIMDPERVAALMDNFRKPQAFTQWTKDRRDDQFKERSYQEVTKPLAAAQAESLVNNSEARTLSSELQLERLMRSGGAGGYKPADSRGDANFFENVSTLMELKNPADATPTKAAMGAVRAKYPHLPPAQIAALAVAHANAGTLDQWLGSVGLSPAMAGQVVPARAGQQRARGTTRADAIPGIDHVRTPTEDSYANPNINRRQALDIEQQYGRGPVPEDFIPAR